MGRNKRKWRASQEMVAAVRGGEVGAWSEVEVGRGVDLEYVLMAADWIC